MKVRILGLGNLLQRDDGLGPAVVELLRKGGDWPGYVEVRDIGTPGPELWQHLVGADTVILVDAVLSGGRPGSLVRLEGPDLLQPVTAPRLGAHAPALNAALVAAALSGGAPRRLILWGLVPRDRAAGVGLSKDVATGLPALVAAIRAEVDALLAAQALEEN